MRERVFYLMSCGMTCQREIASHIFISLLVYAREGTCISNFTNLPPAVLGRPPEALRNFQKSRLINILRSKRNLVFKFLTLAFVQTFMREFYDFLSLLPIGNFQKSTSQRTYMSEEEPKNVWCLWKFLSPSQLMSNLVSNGTFFKKNYV